jgi:hypothetical protein
VLASGGDKFIAVYGRACNRRSFLLEITAAGRTGMLGLGATVLAFSQPRLHSIAACSNYLKLTEVRFQPAF